jgi:hypothetical protein
VHPTPQGGPPPGWYPDPAGERAWRWWDGARWTAYASGPSALTVLPVPAARDSHTGEQATAPWAARGFRWYVVVIAVGLLVAWAESSTFRQLFRDLRVQASSGVIQDQFSRTATDTNLWSLVTVTLAAPFYVLVLIWQYRAASTARLLSLPAAHSAGLGVGSWFIPVVNLWFPYQAVRDCLPPRHPDVRLVGWTWGCYLSAGVATGVAEVLAFFGSPVGFVMAAVALALGVGLAHFGARTVRSIGRAHRDLLFPAPMEGAPPVDP